MLGKIGKNMYHQRVIVFLIILIWYLLCISTSFWVACVPKTEQNTFLLVSTLFLFSHFLDHLILHLQPPGASQCGGLPSLLSGSVPANLNLMLLPWFHVIQIILEIYIHWFNLANTFPNLFHHIYLSPISHMKIRNQGQGIKNDYLRLLSFIYLFA